MAHWFNPDGTSIKGGGGGRDVKSDKKIFCGKTHKNYLIKWQRKEKESSDHTSACYVPLVLGKPTKVLHGTQGSNYRTQRRRQWPSKPPSTWTTWWSDGLCLHVDCCWIQVNKLWMPQKQLMKEQNHQILNALRWHGELRIAAEREKVRTRSWGGRPPEPTRSRCWSAGEGAHATDGRGCWPHLEHAKPEEAEEIQGQGWQGRQPLRFRPKAQNKQTIWWNW